MTSRRFMVETFSSPHLGRSSRLMIRSSSLRLFFWTAWRAMYSAARKAKVGAALSTCFWVAGSLPRLASRTTSWARSLAFPSFMVG